MHNAGHALLVFFVVLGLIAFRLVWGHPAFRVIIGYLPKDWQRWLFGESQPTPVKAR
jgi:hypothetical protein